MELKETGIHFSRHQNATKIDVARPTWCDIVYVINVHDSFEACLNWNVVCAEVGLLDYEIETVGEVGRITIVGLDRQSKIFINVETESSLDESCSGSG